MIEEKVSQELRLKNIDESRYYLIKGMKSKWKKMACTTLN